MSHRLNAAETVQKQNRQLHRSLEAFKHEPQTSRTKWFFFHDQIMSEADLDKDNQLGESEFEHMLKKTPDFME